MSVARDCLLLEISIRLASQLDPELTHLRPFMGHSAGLHQHMPEVCPFGYLFE